MTARTYYAPHGGLPPQTDLLTGRAVFTEAYAVIPKGVIYTIIWDKRENGEDGTPKELPLHHRLSLRSRSQVRCGNTNSMKSLYQQRLEP